MRVVRALTQSHRSLLWLAAVYLAVGLLSRLVLWLCFGREAGVTAAQLPTILAAGAVNDAVQALYLLAPFALLALLFGYLARDSRAYRALKAAGAYLFLFAILYVAAAEYFFFEEFSSRFNLVAVDYLVHPKEVIGNIEASYPVGAASLGVAVVAALALALLWRVLGRTEGRARRARLPGLAVHALLLGLAAGFYQSPALTGADNRVAGELAANGISRFIEAARTRHIDYHAFYRTGDPERMLGLLAAHLSQRHGRFTHLPQGRITRRYAARRNGLGALNVVVVVEESFGAEYIGAYGDRRGLTPEFDALARDGVLFANAYATGTRTVRGLEAISASLPPIPSESILKREGNADITTWGEVMQKQGYHTSFLYGGYGYFDNMNAYFSGNGFAISDRADIATPKFANIWGVSDEDLFTHALAYFDRRTAEGRPFFSIVMTTSNHPPFTFPADAPVLSEGGGRQAGIRYADYALGKFMRMARTRPWFPQTLFVIVGDHGARVYGAAQIPLYSYEIPILLYAPAHLRPRRIETLTSQIDIAPTVLGLLGFAYEAPFFGEDVLNWTGGARILPFNHNYKIALYRSGELAILGLQGEAQSVRHHQDMTRPKKERDIYTPIPPDLPLIELATAYYQTAYDLFQSRRYQ
ncbi:MAG TPA: LTA synthase family protein [Nevskiales bacterium]|nr:LTA synthase family protein [Nevskiales bacterium]